MLLKDLAFWLDYLSKLTPVSVEDAFEATRKIASDLGLLSFSSPVITIAGTNGKGSCAAALEAVYHQAGFRVACYTSPHLFAFNERIRIDTHPVSEEAICHSLADIANHPAISRTNFFHVITLVALQLFQEACCDVIILEVGLGGRWDATNIIDNDIAVLTSIDLDHAERLGSTRELIASEKSEIFRATAVLGEMNIPDAVFEVAQRKGTVLHTVIPTEKSGVSLHPISAACAMKVVELLRTVLPIEDKKIQASLQQLQLFGRCQVISGAFTTVLDVAHNPAACQWLADRIDQLSITGQWYALFSARNDKPLKLLLQPLKDRIANWVIAPLQHIQGAKMAQLEQAFVQLGISAVTTRKSIPLAYQSLLSNLQPGDGLVIFGSFSTVTEAGILGHYSDFGG